MSEPAKVRLVRCPKCENLLPELPDYSVYECGGCGAVLRAKRTNGDVDALSVKSDEERIGGVLERFSEKSGNIDVSEKRMSNLSDVSDNDVRSNVSSVNRAERRRFMPDRIENYGTKAGFRIIEDGREMDRNLNGMSRTKMEREFQNRKPQGGNAILGLQRSGEMPNWTIGEKSEMGDFQRVQRIDDVGMSYSTSNYSEGGPSFYQFRGYAEPLEKRNEMNGFDEVRYFSEDRVELLRKLDELRDQLSRSGEVVNKPNDRIPLDRRMVPEYPYDNPEKWFSEGYSATQYSFPGKHAARPPYVDQYAEISPFVDRHAMAGYGFYPPTHTSGHVHEFEDPLRPQMLRRGPHQPSAAFPQKQSQHTHFRQYMDRNMNQMDSRESYPPNINRHHPSCSCFHCYSKYQSPLQVPPNAYGDRQFSDGSEDLAFYPRENPNEFGTRDNSGNISDLPSFASHNSRLQPQLPSDLRSEVSGSAHSRPSRVLLANSGRRCRPIAGGAPFLSCQNCYELLQLPKKVISNRKNQMKIRCGGCSALIVLVVDTKGLNVSSCVEANQIDGKDDRSDMNYLKEGSSYGPVHPNRASTNFSSEDYDNSGYDFQSMDRELGPLSAGWESSNKSRDVRSSRSTYSSTSEEEESLEKSPAIRKESNSAELLVKGKVSPPPAGSPLQEYFDYSNKYNVANRFGEQNKSGVSEQDKAMPKKTISRQNSMKDASASEIEISSNEYSNTGTSLDSGKASKEGNQLRANKAAESFFAGIMKKSFRDLNKSNNSTDQDYANVTVNGNLIPDRFIKRAEKIAGPIHPGNYWYDFRAGFWGVIGGPCLGIIPPFIEEFNYPMPDNCAGGKTSVLVNGRELHEKDLILLGSRGLPTERDRSYIIEVSGRVLDERAGEELESLGKLAPTVERLKRGFGMKVPKAMA